MQFLSRYWHFFLFPCFLLFTFLLYFQSISFSELPILTIMLFFKSRSVFIGHRQHSQNISWWWFSNTWSGNILSSTRYVESYSRYTVEIAKFLSWYHLTSIVLFAITTWLFVSLFFRALGFPTLLCFSLCCFFSCILEIINRSHGWRDVLIFFSRFCAEYTSFFLHFFEHKKRYGEYFPSLFVLALFTKETAIVLPIVFVGMGMLLNTETLSKRNIFVV